VRDHPPTLNRSSRDGYALLNDEVGYCRGNMNSRTRSFRELLDSSPAQLQEFDVAEMNLLCADGLPGAEGIDCSNCLFILERWTEAVNRFTHDNRASYYNDPGYYHHHQGYFCFLQMVTLIKHPRGLNVAYQPSAIGNFNFSDSRDDLLHGILTRRLGTCTSLPVLFIAIGRRLGYPMHLAIAKQHVLCQWVEADGSHANFEGSGPGGGEMYPDEHYYKWPRPLTEVHLATGRYLRPLTQCEELALFLETRGHCLVDNKRFAEARAAYVHASRIAPDWSDLDSHLRSLEALEARSRTMIRYPRTRTGQGRESLTASSSSPLPTTHQTAILQSGPLHDGCV